MSRKKKQYTTALNNYLAGKIGLPAFYERASGLGVSVAEAEADIIRAKERAASEDRATGMGLTRPANEQKGEEKMSKLRINAIKLFAGLEATNIPYIQSALEIDGPTAETLIKEMISEGLLKPYREVKQWGPFDDPKALNHSISH